MRNPMKWKHVIPQEFETPEKVLKFRKDVRIGIRNLPRASRRKLTLGPCTREERCGNQLCPICVYRFRKQLIQFGWEQQLHQHEWHFVTIRIPPWVMKAGDVTPLAEHVGEPGSSVGNLQVIKSLLQWFRRHARKELDSPPLIVFGSIETQLNVVGNVPEDKPFHIHFLITGIDKDEIKRELRRRFGARIPGGPRIPVKIIVVVREPEDFATVITYCYKQPFQKRVFVNEETKRGRQVWAKPPELAELALNMGSAPLRDRMFMVGIRFVNGKLRLIRN